MFPCWFSDIQPHFFGSFTVNSLDECWSCLARRGFWHEGKPEAYHREQPCLSKRLIIDKKKKTPETARYLFERPLIITSFWQLCKWKLSSLVTFPMRNKDLCSNLGYSLQVSSAFVPNQFHFCCRDILLWKFGSGFSARPSIYSSAPGIMAKDVSIL